MHQHLTNRSTLSADRDPSLLHWLRALVRGQVEINYRDAPAVVRLSGELNVIAAEAGAYVAGWRVP
jgi:hypothetical protein